MLLVEQETLNTVRAARVMSRQIKIDLTVLSAEQHPKVVALLEAIGGVYDEPKGSFRFKCHPHVAIGRAILDGRIIIAPQP